MANKDIATLLICHIPISLYTLLNMHQYFISNLVKTNFPIREVEMTYLKEQVECFPYLA